MGEEEEVKQRRYKGKVVELKPVLTLQEKIKAANERVKMLEVQLSNKLTELSALKDEELLLRGEPESFEYTHRQFLNTCIEEAQKESITHETAIAIVKAQANMSPLDRSFNVKRGFGQSRPSFKVKGDE